MPYCIKCGAYHEDDANFCDKCGNKITNDRPKNYSGEIQVCPKCGEVINPFDTKCALCGYEIRGTKSSNSIREFTLKLEQLEKKRNEINIQDSIKKLIKPNSLSQVEEQIIIHIKNFPIPNNKEDIYEFAILSESNLHHSENEDLDDLTYYQKELRKAWEVKLHQAYKKAKTIFSNDKEFDEIKNLMKKDNSDKSNFKVIVLSIIISLLFVAILIVPTIVQYYNNLHDPNKIMIDCNNDDLVGENYLDVIEILESKGFTNIKTNDLNDLTTGWFYSNGEVKSVSVNGKEEFNRHDFFNKDDLIIITYHSFKD